ncbi:glycosyltransferase [Tenacibaculum retecalamus]|uniref:glycosyltransferase n=1 Tax=Tenacibaculum retecalamus TaxID=3018315 RepID=UPI0023D96E6B|nr:glycosyltransferase [Tenacibaculum retecalamus]WBX70728.1 glycosyltransferase [Tenacibaculum retecalamus]
MKILRVINSLYIGGAERSVAGNVPYHIKNGFAVDVLLLNGAKTFFLEELINNNVNIKKLGEGNNIYNPFITLKICKLLRRYDVVHVSLFPALYWVGIAKIITRSKTKLIYTEHSTYNKRRDNFLLKITDRIIYKQYDEIVAITPETKKNLLDHLKGKHSVCVIYNGVDISKVKKEAKEELSQDIKTRIKGKKIIVQVAGFRVSKDQDTVIKTIAVLPDNFHVLFVGDGERIQTCKNLTKKLGVEEKVSFLGMKKNIGAILKKSDIVVISSHWEGFGRAAIEGMAVRKPVIGTNVSGLAEVLSKAGLLFEVGDVKELTKLILELTEDQEFYTKIADKCFKRAEDFDIKKMVSSYEKVYSKLLKNE